MSKASGRFCATDVELEAIGTYPQSVLTMVQREGRVVPSRGRPLGSGKGATSTSTPKSQNIASTSTSNNTSPKPVTRRQLALTISGGQSTSQQMATPPRTIKSPSKRATRKITPRKGKKVNDVM